MGRSVSNWISPSYSQAWYASTSSAGPCGCETQASLRVRLAVKGLPSKSLLQARANKEQYPSHWKAGHECDHRSGSWFSYNHYWEDRPRSVSVDRAPASALVLLPVNWTYITCGSKQQPRVTSPPQQQEAHTKWALVLQCTALILRDCELWM